MATPAQTLSTCTAKTAQGPVVGHDAAVRRFLGVPYAAAPQGSLRWRPPAPPEPRSAPLQCLHFGDDFPQTRNPLFRAIGQSEDCLYLNIWTPAGAKPGELPVMVWLHGGGFVAGSGSDARCDGAAFAARGAVVVSLNYRSGIFGFFAHPSLAQESDHNSAGNYGLLDQIAALQWIQQNIREFGGSPERIALFGVSAGSASIALLLVSPLARGLFRRAMLHSPGTCRPLGTQADAQALGLTLGDDLTDLRAMSADSLLAKTAQLVPKMRGLTTPRLLRPIRDGWVVPDYELKLFERGDFSAMPIVIGTNADEGTKLTASWTVNTLGEYQALLLSSFGARAAHAAQLYPANSDSEVRGRVAELFADTQFNFGTWHVAGLMARAGHPVYRYLFTRRHPALKDQGPHHGDEVAYVFNTLALQRQFGGFDFSADDLAVAQAMNQAWFNFAAGGNPDEPGIAHWPQYDPHNPRIKVFDQPPGEIRAWRDPQMAFLNAAARG